MSNGGWHNFSFFKSNSSGYIILAKEDVIANTELKHRSVDSLFSEKIELYVWDAKQIGDLVKVSRRISELSADENFIRQDLKRHGIADEDIPEAIRITKNGNEKDRAFYDLIKDAMNDSVKVVTRKIEDVWNDEFPKLYEFIIEKA